MSRQAPKIDPKKVNAELIALTYGAFVAQLVKENDKVEDVNKQLERMGYNIGIRIIEDFLAKTNCSRCLDLKDTAEKIQTAFRMYLNTPVTISNWSGSGDEFSIVIESNPMTEQVELPDNLRAILKYCAVICGAIRGALEMVQLEVLCWIVQDQLKGDPNTELKVRFIRRIEDAVPAGED